MIAIANLLRNFHIKEQLRQATRIIEKATEVHEYYRAKVAELNAEIAANAITHLTTLAKLAELEYKYHYEQGIKRVTIFDGTAARMYHKESPLTVKEHPLCELKIDPAIIPAYWSWQDAWNKWPIPVWVPGFAYRPILPMEVQSKLQARDWWAIYNIRISTYIEELHRPTS